MTGPHRFRAWTKTAGPEVRPCRRGHVLNVPGSYLRLLLFDTMGRDAVQGQPPVTDTGYVIKHPIGSLR